MVKKISSLIIVATLMVSISGITAFAAENKTQFHNSKPIQVKPMTFGEGG